MHNKPLEKRRLADIEMAIKRAKEYAETMDVPLTVERLAAELDMDLSLFHSIAEGIMPCESKSLAVKMAMIQRACGEATASVVEHAMRRGSSTNMHMAYLKNNAGYDRPKAEKGSNQDEEVRLPVVFIGEENISD